MRTARQRMIRMAALTTVVAAALVGCHHFLKGDTTTARLGPSRLPESKAFARFKREQLLPSFAAHYQGLPAAETIQEQVAYQLYRNEVVRRKKAGAHRLEFASPRGHATQFRLRGSGNGPRRYAFRTAWFKR